MKGLLRKIPTQWVETQGKSPYKGISTLSTEQELWGKLSLSNKVPRAPGCEMRITGACLWMKERVLAVSEMRREC